MAAGHAMGRLAAYSSLTGRRALHAEARRMAESAFPIELRCMSNRPVHCAPAPLSFTPGSPARRAGRYAR